jgi:hypothetical protein
MDPGTLRFLFVNRSNQLNFTDILHILIKTSRVYFSPPKAPEITGRRFSGTQSESPQGITNTNAVP